MSRVSIPLLALAAVFALAARAPAAQARQVRVSAHAPAVVLAGKRALVRGRVTGRGVRVSLERRDSGRWREAGPARRAKGGFALRWRSPRRRAVVRLRVVALRAGRRVATSRVIRVATTPTEVLAVRDVVSAPPPGARGTVRYAGRASARVGEFVALDVGPHTPAGLLARVVRRRAAGAGTALDVVPASLIEVVPEGRVELPLRPARLKRSLARSEAPPNFDVPLGCGPGVRATVSGSMAMAVDPSLEIEWAGGSVRSASAAVALHGDADLSVAIAAAASCSVGPVAVATWDAPPVRAFVGPVPVVVVPRTTLNVSATAEARAGVTAGLHGYLSARAGLRYDGERVHGSGSFEHAFTGTQSAPQAGASLGAYAGPSVELLLYGEGGPRFDLSTGVSLAATPGADPWWTLTSPVELYAGLSLPHFDGLNVAQLVVFSRIYPIAQAPAKGTGGGGAGSGDDADASGRTRARIGWDTASTDVDLHVWDADGNHASYEAPGVVPGGVLSADDRNGFGPERFADDASSDGPLTFGICYFDDRGAGPTTVDVELTDRDASVRTLSRTLSAKGDGVLVGSSPDGQAYAPPDGWCSGAP